MLISKCHPLNTTEENNEAYHLQCQDFTSNYKSVLYRRAVIKRLIEITILTQPTQLFDDNMNEIYVMMKIEHTQNNFLILSRGNFIIFILMMNTLTIAL